MQNIDQQAQQLPHCQQLENNQKQTISKKQTKKIQKKLKWQLEKKERRYQQRKKQKQKKKLKQKLVNEQKSIGQIIESNVQIVPQKKRKEEYLQKMKKGIIVVIDLQFYHLMTEKEKFSLIKQLSYCHHVNRKYKKAFNFIVTSATEQRKQQIFERYNSENWGITFTEESILEYFPIDKIVYLTGDAKEQLNQLQQQDIYIIGGIVDHNRLKQLTINYANQQKIRSCKLPIKNYKLKASVHLAVNHIWEWLLRVYNGNSWSEALEAVIPSRKIQKE